MFMSSPSPEADTIPKRSNPEPFRLRFRLAGQVRARVVHALAWAARRASWKRIVCALVALALIPFCMAVPQDGVFTFEDGDSLTANGAILSADGKTLITQRNKTHYSFYNTAFCIWDLPTRSIRSVVRPKHPDRYMCAISTDGRMCVQSAGGGSGLTVWDTTTGDELVSLPDNRGVISRDNRRLLSWDQKMFRVCSLPDGKQIAALPTGQDHTWATAVSSDGSLVATGGPLGEDHQELKIKVWNVTDGTLLAAFPSHIKHYGHLAFSPDGKTLAGVGTWGSCYNLSRYEHMGVRLWDVQTGRERPERPESVPGRYPREHQELPNTHLAFSPDGRWVAAGHEWTLGVWDVASGKLVASYGLGGWRRLFPRTGGYLSRLQSVFDADPPPEIKFMSFTPDGQLLVFGDAYDHEGTDETGKLTMWALTLPR